MRFCMYGLLLAGAAFATPCFSQEINSNSTSNAGANSGSASSAGSDVTNAANNAIGNSTSVSGSESTANSGSVSGSESNGNLQDQGQGQTQTSSNSQGQGQDQGQGQTQGQATDQANQQETQVGGQSTSLTFNSSSPKKLEVRTNTPVGLAASSSFSSDYCGGTVSGGGSFAPLGISLGGSAPKFDKSCQALRRAEKFGMAAANAHNMAQPELAGQLLSMMIWSICTSDSGGPNDKYPTAQACMASGLLGSQASIQSPRSNQPIPAKAPEPKVAVKGNITPEAAVRARASAQDDRMALATGSAIPR